MVNLKYTATLFVTATLLMSGCSSTSNSKSASTTNVQQQGTLSLDGARYAHAMVNDGEKLYVIGGSHNSDFLSSIEIIDPATKKTLKLNGKIIPRRYFSAVWDGNESIYIVGGVSLNGDHYKYEKRVEVFNTKTHEVTLVKNLPAPTRTNSAVLKDGKIFVFGGGYPRAKSMKYQPTVAVYDLIKDTWQRGQDMPTAKATEAFVKDDYIYVVGGYNGKQSLNTFERYDPTLNRWQSLPAIPYRLSAHSIALKGEKLFVFGNYLDTSATYSYDFKTQQWQKSDLDFVAARHTAATTMDDVIYVSGGITNSSGPSIDNLQIFN